MVVDTALAVVVAAVVVAVSSSVRRGTRIARKAT